MSRALRERPALAVAAVLFVVYCTTLARGVTYWDAGEFLAAIHSLGIPHPPGTPLFVLLARVWSMLAGPVVGFTLAVNAFSALCTAAAMGIITSLFSRWTRDRTAAIAAGLLAGLTSTVWLNATETEVYAVSLLGALVILWTADRWSTSGRAPWLLLALYLCGLGWALHLTALLVVPTAAYLIFAGVRRPEAAAVVTGLGLAVLGGSAVLFMLLRARHDPAINQGNPATWAALYDAVQRHQYDVAPLWPRRAPLWLQFGNTFEYADWQFALGLAPDPPPSVLRTSVTLVYAALGLYGAMRHRAADVRSWRAWLIFFLTTSVGVVIYLNLRAGASYGFGVLPPGALHEARDRDYFFMWAFVCWGAWAGFGAVRLARRATDGINGSRTNVQFRTVAVALALSVACAPLLLNWSAIRFQRGDEQRKAEAGATAMLHDLPKRAVFLAHGDNDTYPLWYMQQVRGMRRDVVVVTIPLLSPEWYRAELLRRHALLDSSYVRDWHGSDATLADLRARAATEDRPVVESPFFQATR